MDRLIKAVLFLVAFEPQMLNAQTDGTGGVVVEQPCFQIDDIEIVNASIFREADFEPLLAEFTGNCLGQISINNLIDRISSRYADAGFITSRAYVPAQDVGRGALTIEVLEGRIEAFNHIQVRSDGTSEMGPSRKITTAMPQSVGDVFQLRDLEHGLENMNRLGASQAAANLSAGEAPGTSVVTITENVADRWRGTATIDNRGSESTGRTQVELGLQVDDLLEINDSWSGSYSGSRNSNALSLSLSAPFRRYRFSGSLSYSEEDTELTDVSFLLSQTLNARLTGEYMIFRTATASVVGYLGLGLYRNERTINLTELTPQRRSSATFGARYENRWAGGVFSADTSVSLGARFWEADWNADIDDRRVPETDYVTLNSVVTYVRALENGDQWSTTVTAQMAEEALFSNNQISIGGWGTVRGNSKDSFSGDRGLYLRTEYSLQARRIRSVQRYFELPIVFRPAFFADVGRVDSIAQLRTRSLSGVGTSVSFQAGRARIDGAIAIPVGGAERREGQGAEAYLQFFSSIF